MQEPDWARNARRDREGDDMVTEAGLQARIPLLIRQNQRRAADEDTTMSSVTGIHHITCIAGDPQENVDFYTRVLGMRLVKKSVNQDVPDTYHLFYADGEAHPGADLTFFPWPKLPPVQKGGGLAVDGCRRAPGDDSALARPSQHQPDLDVSGGEWWRVDG